MSSKHHHHHHKSHHKHHRSNQPSNYSEEDNHSGSEGESDSDSDGYVPASTSHLGHVRTGYIAALHNDRVSEKAKKHARKMLEKLPGHGKVEYEQNELAKKSRENYRHDHETSEDESSEDEKYFEDKGTSSKHAPSSTSHLGHVRTGYLAALHNDRVSDKAKKHARKMLEKMPGHGKVEYEQTEQARKSREYYRDHHDETSEDESSEDEKYIEDRKGRSKSPSSDKYSRSKSPSSSSSGKYSRSKSPSSSDKYSRSKSPSSSRSSSGAAPPSMSHLGHVRTGYVASLHNDRVSEKAKKHARKMLDKLPGHGKVEYEQNDQARRGREYYHDAHNSEDSEEDEKYFEEEKKKSKKRKSHDSDDDRKGSNKRRKGSY